MRDDSARPTGNGRVRKIGVAMLAMAALAGCADQQQSQSVVVPSVSFNDPARPPAFTEAQQAAARSYLDAHSSDDRKGRRRAVVLATRQIGNTWHGVAIVAPGNTLSLIESPQGEMDLFVQPGDYIRYGRCADLGWSDICPSESHLEVLTKAAVR